MRTTTINETAAILGCDPKTLRRWIKAAGMTATRGESDAREWHLTQAQVDRLARLHARGGGASTVGRLEELEREIRELKAHIASIKRQNAREGHLEVQETALPDPVVSPYHFDPPRQPDSAPTRGYALTYGTDAPAVFSHRADAGRWLARHGVNELTPKTWPGWRAVELTPRAVLALALSLMDTSNHRVTWRLRRCDDDACVCRELL